MLVFSSCMNKAPWTIFCYCIIWCSNYRLKNREIKKNSLKGKNDTAKSMHKACWYLVMQIMTLTESNNSLVKMVKVFFNCQFTNHCFQLRKNVPYTDEMISTSTGSNWLVRLAHGISKMSIVTCLYSVFSKTDIGRENLTKDKNKLYGNFFFWGIMHPQKETFWVYKFLNYFYSFHPRL